MFRYDVLVSGESRWASNALRFDTEEEALAAAHDLYGRWMMASKFRIMGADAPQREPYVPGSEHPNWK